MNKYIPMPGDLVYDSQKYSWAEKMPLNIEETRTRMACVVVWYSGNTMVVPIRSPELLGFSLFPTSFDEKRYFPSFTEALLACSRWQEEVAVNCQRFAASVRELAREWVEKTEGGK